MKIMLLTHSFSPDVSPPQRRWSVIVEEFARLGNSVTVVTPTPTQRFSGQSSVVTSQENVLIRRYRSVSTSKSMAGKVFKHGVEALFSLPAALKTAKPDVVIATVPALPTMAVGYVVSKIRRVPFVIDLRDAWPDLLNESKVLKFRWLEPIVTSFLGSLIRHSDLLVTVTEGLALRMRKSGVRNVAAVSNGVDTSIVRSLPNPDRTGGQSLNVLYLGNLGRSQGLETLLQAVKLISPGVNLRIVGNGTEKSKLQELALRLGIKVDFRDSVYGDEVLENYAWADTAIVSLRPDWPSFEHTVPSKIYELMYLDKHVTGLVRGEAARIIGEAHAGEVVEQNAAALAAQFKRYIEYPETLRTFGQGRQWVLNNASLRGAGREYLELLGKLTGEM